MSRLTVGSLEGLSENSNVISVPTGHTLNAVDGIQAGGENITPYTGRRNLLYNGAMRVAQRGTSVAGVTSSGYHTADRWKSSINALGTWTQSVENDAPSDSGISTSLKMLCTTADASPAAGDYCVLEQVIEGQDAQVLCKGTGSAKESTLSFWVKSNVTGTYVIELRDIDNSRQVSKTFTVNASETWERKTIVYPADTTGSFDNDNNGSLVVLIWLAAGSTYSSGTLNTSWGSDTATNRAVGQTNLASATSNYWQITGVQLEVGDKATPFEHRSYGEELALCRRYCQVLTSNDTYTPIGIGHFNTTTQVICPHRLAPQMRVAPSFSINNPALVEIEPYDQNATASILSTGNSEDYAVLEVISPTARTVGDAATLILDASGGVVIFDAEL